MPENLDKEPEQSAPEPAALEPQLEADAAQPSFAIVGIGASAGGVEAFSQLLQVLPADTGMAFVLILHLDPTQPSYLSEILARTTRMSVREAQDGMLVEPNCVYLIPPNRKITLSKGTLKLSPRENTNGRHLPVDAFFRSLAEQLGSKAIAVVLTGGDGDGSRGLEAIKERGGLTFAQDEQSSRVSGMPRSAVATGQVDFVLPPQQIAEALGKLAHQQGGLTPGSSAKDLEQAGLSEEQALEAVFGLLGRASGADFSQYKRPMIQRRIQRRMVLQQIEQTDEYVRYLKVHPAEVQALCQELLINVTDFFRDPEMFEALGNEVFDRLLTGRSSSEPIRIWVAGCSTGQEAYSLAICLLEYLAEQHSEVPIQIFATDLSEEAIEQARRGVYRKSQLESVCAQRLERFFAEVEGGYQVSPSVRATCVFARQNLALDPPFSKIDLVSCRNVLIYFLPALQKRVLSALHFALKPGGYLWLGNSESVGDDSGFSAVERKHKLYARNSVPIRLGLGFLTSPTGVTLRGAEVQSNILGELELKQEADRIAAERYLPPGLIVNSNLEIVELRGRVSEYLELAPGRPSSSLTKMLSTNLQLEVRTAIHQAGQQNTPVRKEGILLGNRERVWQCTLEVIALQLPASERYFLVQFVETAAPSLPPVVFERADTVALSSPSQQEQQISKLQKELTLTQGYLQTIIEAYETSDQDLRVANEEVLSSNEELQSINEELQTAKEELQATNEELITLNDEQQQRNADLALSSSDLVNLLTSTQIPILILNSDLRIRRFTQPAAALLHLIDADVGRPLGDISPQLEVPDLQEQILAVVRTLLPTVQEVQDREGHWYEMRIRPYRTLDNKIEGAVVILQDIDALKSSARALEAAHQRTETIVETVRESLLVLDERLRVISANRAFYETFQVLPAQTLGRSIFELGNGQWNSPSLRALLEEVLPQNSQIQDFEVEYDFEQVGHKQLLLNASRLAETPMILLAITDVTHRKRLERERLASETSQVRAEEANRHKDEFLAILSHELRTPLNPIIAWTQMLRQGRVPAAKQTQVLEVIERNAKLQNQLIGDLLDISRIEQGKFHCSMRPVDLRLVVKAAVEAVLQSAEAVGVEMSVNAVSSAAVVADPTRLQQVVWNLLTNALKFTPEGGRVEVQLSVEAGQVRLVVRDTGVGIPAPLLPNIFDCFRQADSSTTRIRGGLGLGLYIVRQVVQMHKGRVWAESAGEGKGATFTVELPAAEKPLGQTTG